MGGIRMATDSVIAAIDQCKKCIDEKRSFVLQGGAGSGKTESLKELLIYINQITYRYRLRTLL